MIRPYNSWDLEALKRIHAKSGLPANCWPNLENSLYQVRVVAEENHHPVQAGFVKITGECYVMVDHHYATPEKRWEILQELVIHGLHQAAQVDLSKSRITGLEDATCWLPPSLEKQFWPRLKSLGFEKSPWQSYTAVLK
jgi:hypothetical protein